MAWRLAREFTSVLVELVERVLDRRGRHGHERWVAASVLRLAHLLHLLVRVRWRVPPLPPRMNGAGRVVRHHRSDSAAPLAVTMITCTTEQQQPLHYHKKRCDLKVFWALRLCFTA